MATYGNYTYGEHFVMYVIVGSLCHTPKTNVVLPVNYASVKNNK